MMTSPLLALFVRALRESVRSRLTYGLRAGVVLTAALGIFITGKLVGWTGAPGLEIFRTLCWTQLLFIIMAGLTNFAMAITEEKEDGTLDLLRLTNLGPMAILVGKSGNRLVIAALLLAVPLPLALLATTLGGLTIRQILASQIAVGAFLFLICQLALLCSVLAARGPMATLLSGLAISGYLALPGLLPRLGTRAAFLGPRQIQLFADELAGTLWDMLPWVRLEEVFTTNYSGPLLGPEVWSYLAGGTVCFLLAYLVFGRFGGENEGLEWQAHWFRGLSSAKAGSGSGSMPSPGRIITSSTAGGLASG
ncbi:MAG: hypothetical protein QOE70_2557 [Chthoniobacter sp.]|jgi:ABC-type transport system involved in cytochrome c biogenesis permease component|nr:hypothetical protein [Chthoniobacter sp.]